MPAGPFVWLSEQSPQEAWARGVPAMGSGTHSQPGILNPECVFPDVLPACSYPQKASGGLGEACGSSGRKEGLWTLGFGPGPRSLPFCPSSWTLCCAEVGAVAGKSGLRGSCPTVRGISPRGLPGGPKCHPPELTCPPLSPAPDEAPAIVSVTPHTTTSVLIRWQVGPRRRGGAPILQGLRHTLCCDEKDSSCPPGAGGSPEHGTHSHRPALNPHSAPW